MHYLERTGVILEASWRLGTEPTSFRSFRASWIQQNKLIAVAAAAVDSLGYEKAEIRR